MQIASAFLMGTKIKEIDVPANPWSEMTAYPNTSGAYIKKSGASYNGRLYMIAGNGGSVAQGVATSMVMKVYNGSSWSDAVTIQVPAYGGADWYLTPGDSVMCTYQGRLYIFAGKLADYGAGGQANCWVFDGTTATFKSQDSQGNSFPKVHQACVKDDKLYLFALRAQGSAWAPVYRWDVYEYNGTTDIIQQVATEICVGLQGLQNITSRVNVLNGKFHVIDGTAHWIINDDWTYSALTAVPVGATNSIVYKGKLHAFGAGEGTSPYAKNHQIYNAGNDTWSVGENIPYSLSAIGYNGYAETLPIIHKNKIWLLGSNQTLGYNALYDEIYRYNR